MKRDGTGSETRSNKYKLGKRLRWKEKVVIFFRFWPLVRKRRSRWPMGRRWKCKADASAAETRLFCLFVCLLVFFKVLRSVTEFLPNFAEFHGLHSVFLGLCITTTLPLNHYPVLRSLIGFHWFLMSLFGFAGLYLVLLRFTKSSTCFHTVSFGFNGHNWVLFDSTEFYWVLLCIWLERSFRERETSFNRKLTGFCFKKGLSNGIVFFNGFQYFPMK